MFLFFLESEFPLLEDIVTTRQNYIFTGTDGLFYDGIANKIFLNFIYLFLTALGLRCFTWALVAENRDYSLAVVCWLLLVVASHCRARAVGRMGFHSCSTHQSWVSPVAQTVKNLPALQETQVQSLGQKDPLEKGMTTCSSILAWRIPWTEEPGGLQSMGSQSWTRRNDECFHFSCGTRALGHAGFISCSTWAQQMWVLGSKAWAP